MKVNISLTLIENKIILLEIKVHGLPIHSTIVSNFQGIQKIPIFRHTSMVFVN